MRIEEQQGSLPVCVEPEDCLVQPDEFKDLNQRVKLLLEAPSATQWFHSSESIAKRYERTEYRRVVSTAIEEIVESATDADQWLTFCSHASPVKNYLVVAVLQLNRSNCEALPSLALDQRNQMRVPRSILRATAAQFISHCTGALSLPDPGENFGGGNAGELLRAAGRSLGYTAASAGGDCSGWHTFYDACNIISSLKYEGGVGSGQLIVANRNNTDLHHVLMFESPIVLTDYYAVRKLLELASGDTYLYTDSYEVFGVGKLAENFNAHLEDLFIIRFASHHVWELCHGSATLMRVAHNEPRLPLAKLDHVVFLDIAKRVLQGVTDDDARYIAQLAYIAAELRHGSLMIIATDAADEAVRLERQAIRIRPVRMTAELLRRTSSIDGALLLDTSATCHAIGVILDGLASRKATASRGSRYNSAIRYVYGRKQTIAIVVSEDGMVNLLPNLMPRIRRADLDSYIDKIREIANRPTVARKEYYEVERWFARHKFYLSVDECSELNRLFQQGINRFNDDAMKVLPSTFQPNEDLDDSYFILD